MASPEVTYTVKEMVADMHKKMDELHQIQLQTLAQAQKTNGRVTVLEKKSIGLWIANHPFRFAIFAVLTIAMLISDIRHPLFMFLGGLL